MKNCFILLIIIFCIIPPQFSMAEEVNYCQSNKTVDISGGFSRFMQGMTGVNLVSSAVGKRIIKKEIAKELTGKIKVKFDMYSGMDLAEGKLKSLQITGRNVRFNNLRMLKIAYFDFKSKCSPVIFNVQNKKDLQDSIHADFIFKIHEKDMNKALRRGFLLNGLKPFKLNLPALGQFYFDFLMPHVEILHDRLVLSANMKTAGNKLLNFIPIRISLTPFVNGNSIMMKNLGFNAKESSHLNLVAKFIENELTTLYNFKKLASNRFTIYPSSIKVEKPYIILKGTISTYAK